jgi:uncharacterized 2Fe-2S/4Fe-4S cluster protein (DUF4445 family)
VTGRGARVTFEGTGASVEVALGTTLRDAAALAGVAIDSPCGGLGSCGRCSVEASGALESPSADERVLVTEEALAAGVRLSCRAKVAGDVSVRPVGSAGSASLRIVEAGAAGEVAIEAPAARGISGDGPLLGAVVDIGTTTVVVAIVDLATAEQLGSASALNPQHPFGHDVMSRITHTASHGTDSLRQPIVDAIESLALGVLAEIGQPPEQLREVAIAGNTTMIHLLLGIDPAPLGTAPYEPAFLSPLDRPASEIGLNRLPAAQAYVVPGISAFVGADITAGLLVTRLDERERPTILIDLGTNGEIVIRTPDGLLASSTAAGPALEGASIAYGMRAEEGAIERVSLAGDELAITTIGGARAKGLCGSGLLDLIAILLDAGVIQRTGRLRCDAPHPLAARVSERDGTRVFEIAPDVYLTQRDVRQVQLANAAIASGLLMLLDAADVPAQDVGELIIAGGFGYHVRAEALVRMGTIPPAWADRVSFAGNTAMSGTLLALLDSAARRRAEALARHVETVDLASHPDFQERFVAGMSFPTPEVPAVWTQTTSLEELL